MVGCFTGPELHVHNPVNTKLLDLLQTTGPQMLPQLMMYCKIYFIMWQSTEHDDHMTFSQPFSRVETFS